MPDPEGQLIKAEAKGRWNYLAALVTAALLLPSLLYPFGRDQAVFAYVGSVMARGGMPYRDAWDLKPPGIYLAYALLASLSQEHGLRLMLLLRIADLAVTVGVGILLAGIARKCGRPEAALAAAGWYASLYLQGGYWGLAQAESWANLFVLGSLLLCLASRTRSSSRLLFSAGLLGGIAAVLKFTTLAPLIPFWILVLLQQRADQLRSHGALLIGGLLLPLAGTGAWLAATGALLPYLEIQRGFVAPYTRLSASGPLQHLVHLVRHTGLWAASIWLPALLACLGTRQVEPKRVTLGVLVPLLMGGLIAVWVQDKYFGYHWQTVLPAVALLAAFGCVDCCRRAGLSARTAQAVGLLAVALWTAATQGSYYRDAARVALGKITYSTWLARFGRPGGGDNSFLADTWAATYVRNHTRPEDPVLVWGFEPAVYLLSDRRPPSRFFFNVPVTSPFVPETWRQEFLRDLRSRPPVLFLCLRNDAVPWASGRTDDSQEQLHNWPELRHWLAKNYREETSIEDFTIYRRVQH